MKGFFSFWLLAPGGISPMNTTNGFKPLPWKATKSNRQPSTSWGATIGKILHRPGWETINQTYKLQDLKIWSYCSGNSFPQFFEIFALA